MCIRKDSCQNAAIKRSISDIDTDVTSEDPALFFGSPGSRSDSCCSLDPLPPENSILFDSLERGLLAREFCDLQQVGRGGFGKVVKAWHRSSSSWVALKLIPMQLKASETVDDNHTNWSGPEVFQQLQQMRSSKVLRYARRWTELPQDLPDAWSHFMQSPRSARTIERRPMDDPLTPVSTMNLSEGLDSSSGFEWVVTEVEDSPPTPQSVPKPRKERSKGFEKHYDVVLVIEMEYCDGITLADWLANPSQRPKLIKGGMSASRQIFKQLIQGLADLHEVGIVHWDIKPANILLSKDGQVKIFDFGLAKLSTSERAKASCDPFNGKQQQVSQTAIGTPGYAPPEHCIQIEQNKKVGAQSFVLPPSCPKSDIFSAGIVLVELLMAGVAGDGPIWKTSMERVSVMASLRDGRDGSLPFALRTLGAWMRQLVFRMVAWDADARPSAKEVLDELDADQWASGRHNPFLGTQNSRSPQFASMLTHLSAAHNPYIGFFLDHGFNGGFNGSIKVSA